MDRELLIMLKMYPVSDIEYIEKIAKNNNSNIFLKYLNISSTIENTLNWSFIKIIKICISCK